MSSADSNTPYQISPAVAADEASTAALAREVENNAKDVRDAAAKAALVAQNQAPRTSSAIEQLEGGLGEKTNAATAAGAADTRTYVKQATDMASSAAALATTAVEAATPMVNSAINAATPVVKSAINAATSAANTVVPLVTSAADSAVNVAQPPIDAAKKVVAGSTGSSAPAQPSEVPKSTAPLQSGPNVVDSPYPATTTKVGEL